MSPSFLGDGSRQYNRAHRIHPRDPVSQLGYYLSSSTLPSSGTSSSSSVVKNSPELFVGIGSSGADQDPAEQWEDVNARTRRNQEGSYLAGQQGSIARYSRSATRLARTLLGRRVSGERTTDPTNGAEIFMETQVPSRGQVHESDRWINLRNRRPASRKKPANEPSDTPVGSSGFSDETNTQNEATLRENYLRPAYQIGLENANFSRDWQPPDETGWPVWQQQQHLYVKGATKHADAAELTGKRSVRLMSGSLRKSQQQVAIARPAAPMTRLKRRNMNRSNRRMLVDGNDHLVNPYALSELFSQSEIPGFREIFASDSYLRKFCWIVAFLFMTVLSLNDMTELITEYYEYPITVDLRLRDSARLPFPSVTVCNLNVVRFSALCSFSSTSSGQSARFNLTNQIPSELRDKLCGIQVEKKNTTSGDSDINDINNIGITTTTTTTTTTSSTAGASDGTATVAAISTSSSSAGSSAATASSTGSWQASSVNTVPSLMDVPPPLQLFPKGTTVATKWTTQRPTDPDSNKTKNGPQTGIGGDRNPAEHKTHSAPAATSTQTVSAGTSFRPSAPQTSSSRSNGALDLGDFTDSSLLVMDGVPVGRRARLSGRRGRRSFRLSTGRPDGLESDWVTQYQRPFAPARSRIRVGIHRTGASSDSRLQTPVYSQHHQLSEAAGQFMQPPISAQANRIGANNNNPQGYVPGQQPAAHGANRNGVPVNPMAAVTALKSFQNPLLNNVQPSTTPLSQTSSATPTSTFNPPALPEDFELTERQERELQENLTNWLAVMNNRDPELTWWLGHQFDDMILRCTMKSLNCTHQRSFENSFTPTEGNCFTYRSKIRRRGVKTSGSASQFEEANLASINHGLELVLNLEKNEYMSGSSQVGALVMVHHPNDLGYAASEATFVAPEFTTYIGLKMVNITRLPAPYPEYCVDSWPKLFAETLTRNSTYSQQACLRICLQTTIQTHCHCQSAFLPIVELEGNAASGHQHQQVAPAGFNRSSGGGSTLQLSEAAKSEQAQSQGQQQRIIICDTRKTATRQCVREVMLRAADRVHNCECPPKCQVVRYDKTVSMARWPTREDRVTFDRGKMDVNFQNLAKVIVYFQTMTCDEVTQQAVFNAAKLFSALGGIMGMYVGFSFLSVFEIFEVMSRKMWHHFSAKLADTRSRVVSSFERT